MLMTSLIDPIAILPETCNLLFDAVAGAIKFVVASVTVYVVESLLTTISPVFRIANKPPALAVYQI